MLLLLIFLAICRKKKHFANFTPSFSIWKCCTWGNSWPNSVRRARGSNLAYQCGLAFPLTFFDQLVYFVGLGFFFRHFLFRKILLHLSCYHAMGLILPLLFPLKTCRTEREGWQRTMLNQRHFQLVITTEKHFSMCTAHIHTNYTHRHIGLQAAAHT